MLKIQTLLTILFAANDTGQIIQWEYEFDDLGNLTSREDILTSQKEIFDYDRLNRLINIEYWDDETHIRSADISIG